MKVLWLASIGLAAMSILAPRAEAQQHQVSVTLVQTAKLITRTHPGVSADILGIHIGMTLPEAEAMAAKSFPGKTHEYKTTAKGAYRDLVVQSQPYVSRVEIRGVPFDNVLVLHFSSPVTGNVVVGMERTTVYSDSRAPLVSAVMADLIKQYGSFSCTDNGPGNEVYEWDFDNQSLEHRTADTCLGLDDSAGKDSIPRILRQGVTMAIMAYPVALITDKSKVMMLNLSIEDLQDDFNSANATREQLDNAAMKHSPKF